MDTKNRVIRLTIIFGCIVGGIFAVVWPMYKYRSESIAASLTPTPIVSIEEAQHQVRFLINVPKITPSGFRLIGARVVQVKSLDTQADIADRRSHRIKHTGYGVLFVAPQHLGLPITVMAAPASPAEKEGLHSDYSEPLVAINDVNMEPGPNGTPPLPPNLANSAPPLRIKLKEDGGTVRTINLTHKGDYYIGGQAPSLPTDKQAAILYTAPHGSVAVVESVSHPGPQPSYVGGSWDKTINGTIVTFYGSKETPDATFARGGINYDIVNDKGNLDEADIERMVQGL